MASPPPPQPLKPPRTLSEDHFRDCIKGSPWDYQDESGAVLYREARHADDRTFQYHRNGSGWTDGRGTERRVLLDLPLVASWISKPRLILLCEGPKKARMLAALGFAATANDCGALGFCAQHAECLRGAPHVVVVLDNDRDGRRRGELVPPLLHAVGVVKIQTLLPPVPEGKGIDDWLAERNTKPREALRAELAALVRRAERWSPSPSPLVLTRLSGVTPRSLSWFWKHRIPKGMVTVLAGHGGLGKSTLMLDLAARVSTGRPMPDGDGGGTPGAVVIFTAEDALDSVVVPRLILAGADLSRIVTLGARTGEGVERPLLVTLADLALLEETIRAEAAVLVIYDPLVSYVDSDINLHHAHDTRRVLASLHRLAERLGIAVVGIHHWNKSQTPDPTMRFSGSAALVQAARSALVVGPDPEDASDERMVLALAKRNLAPRSTPSLAFRLDVEADAEHPRVAWLGESSVTAGDMAAVPVSAEDRSTLDEAADFLRSRLAEGPARVVSVKAEARSAGISERTLERAKQRLKVHAIKRGGAAGDGWWEWSLPAPPSLGGLSVNACPDNKTAKAAAKREEREEPSVADLLAGHDWEPAEARGVGHA